MENIKDYAYGAARDGKLQSLKMLLYLKSKFEVSELITVHQNGITLFSIACKNGHLEVVQYLIEKCYADVEEIGKNIVDGKEIEGVTPLWCAAAAGQLSIVETLIKHKAYINSTTSTKSTPLRAACYAGHFEVVRYLIKNGANMNIVNCKGQTCLMVACYKGHYEICNYLVMCGAKVDTLDAYGNSALNISVKLGNLEMAKCLIELGANVHIAGCYEELSKLIYSYPNGATSLLQASLDGNLEIIKYLINKCHANIEEVGVIRIDSENIEGASPLWCAAFAGHLDIVKTLIEHKASINKTTQTKSTPLRAASCRGHIQIVKYLVENGANIDIVNIHGSTCLLAALYKGHNEISKYLIDCGANVNIQDSYGDSSLSVSLHTENTEMIEYLINHKANIEVSDSFGRTCLILACIKNNFEIAKFLLRCGANVDRKTLKGTTALHICAESNNLDMVEELFKKGAKLYVDSFGATPLLRAALKGHFSIIDFFKKNYEITKEEEVHTYELLGAFFADKTERHMIGAALLGWEMAMEVKIRYHIEKCFVSSLAPYLDTTEVNTINELRNLRADYSEIKKQSLLMRERILDDSHPDTILCIRTCGARYADNGDYERCIQLWMYALELEQETQKPLSPGTLRIFELFLELFSHLIMKFDTVISKELVLVLFQSMLCVFQKIVTEIERTLKVYKMKDFEDSYIIILAMYDVGLICKLLPHLNQFEKFKLKKAVYQFIHLNPIVENGLTPLHLAFVVSVTITIRYVVSLPSLEIVDLLLEVGANPNAINYDHNSPLHLAAMIRPCPVSILKLLLDSGAHLDLRNLDNLTPLQLIPDADLINFYPLKHLNLKCLCAQTINMYNIPYKDIVPRTVCEFLCMHYTH